MDAQKINLAAFALLIGLALIAFLTTGQGPILQGVVLLLGLGSAGQMVVLWWAARRLRPSPAFATKPLFALWAAAIYPFSLVDRPELPFPTWVVFASIPIGYAIAYLTISALLWMTRLQAKWLDRLRASSNK